MRIKRSAPVVLGLVAWVVLTFTTPAITQNIARLVGTLSTGGAKNVAVDSNGSMKISLLAGGSTQTYRPAGTAFWDDTDAPNLADTNWVISPVYALPAATFATDGDRLDYQSVLVLSAAASTKTYDCRIGYSSFSTASGFAGGITVFTNSTSGTSDTFILHLEVTRQSATTASAWGYGVAIVGNALKAGGNYQTGQALTWANAQNVACAVKDGTGNAAAITIRESRAWFHTK